MNQIFLGMLFVFLDLTLNINNCTIDFLPDFVGYILMMKGLREMESESACFTKSRPWAMGWRFIPGCCLRRICWASARTGASWAGCWDWRRPLPAW